MAVTLKKTAAWGTRNIPCYWKAFKKVIGQMGATWLFQWGFLAQGGSDSPQYQGLNSNKSLTAAKAAELSMGPGVSGSWVNHL